MGTDTMGRVTVAATIENLGDLYMVEKGVLPADQVHRIEVSHALVDTGGTTLLMPKTLIERLALIPFRTRVARTSAGLVTFQVYGAARLTVQGRECQVDVVELPEGSPVLIGQVPLELVDFVVDPAHNCLIGNPAHGGEQMIEMYREERAAGKGVAGDRCLCRQDDQPANVIACVESTYLGTIE
jgi:predicted aspartyl protease